jgi:glycosyltransferase involved in cell wall biosynthesis
VKPTVPVSVVIPAFNAEAVVCRAIESVLRQTLAPTEIILVDDGSTDGTRAAVERYDACVRCLTQPNAGVSAARNRGIDAATQGWVALLDADDEWLPSKLETQWSLITRHPAIVWVGANATFVIGGTAKHAKLPRRVSERLSNEEQIEFFTGWAHGLFLHTTGMLIRRDVFDDVGRFDTDLRLGEDRNMWWRIAFRNPSIGYRPEVLYRYYLDTPGSLSKRSRDRSQSVLGVCRSLEAATNEGAAVVKLFAPFAERLVADYRLRAACGEIDVDAAVWRQVNALFPPSRHDRLLSAFLTRLPSVVARLLSRFVA